LLELALEPFEPLFGRWNALLRRRRGQCQQRCGNQEQA
jgi:hypothetical protein